MLHPLNTYCAAGFTFGESNELLIINTVFKEEHHCLNGVGKLYLVGKTSGVEQFKHEYLNISSRLQWRELCSSAAYFTQIGAESLNPDLSV